MLDLPDADHLTDTRGVPLTSSPCRELCDWVTTRGRAAADPLLACRGCGTQWQPGLGWTPRQADGSIPGAALTVLRATLPKES